MKAIDPTAPFRQLIDRRLWPLAVLLLAGLLAVPLLLAKDGGEAVPMASSQTALTPAAASTQPVVSVADAGTLEDRRKVLGSAKDPFRPARGPRAEDTTAATPQVVTPVGDAAPSSGGGSGAASPSAGTPAGAPSGPPSPYAPPAQQPTAPKSVYELYSLVVRFGDSTADRLERSNLKRLKAMPSVEEPAVIYLGMMRDRKTAVFLVDAGTHVQGDGRCMPSASNCQTLQLKVGETAFFDVSDENGVAAQYQLDVVKVMLKRTTDADAAKRSMTAEASGGRSSLRARMSRVGPYRYDARSGSLKRISRKAHRAAAARASAR